MANLLRVSRLDRHHSAISPIEQYSSEEKHSFIDECCLASKLYLGHAESLLDSCDALFVPSIDNLGLHEVSALNLSTS